MIHHISIILTSFSVIAVLVLLTAYLFFLPDMRKSLPGKIACSVLLIALALIQVAHYHYFTTGIDLVAHRSYGTLLITVPASFFFFARVVLFPDVKYRWLDVLHLLPPAVSLVIPTELLPPAGFVFGTAYTFWFAHQVLKLRGRHGRSRFEIFFFCMFALMALIALGLGLALPYLDHHLYYTVYANAISLAMLLVLAALIFFPELLSDMLLVTELAYAKTKLAGIDTDTKIVDLERLMSVDKHYQNEELSLSNLAELMDLTPHQLSELINTHYGYGFPRLVREHRVHEAKKLLLAEPTASVLSISMMTGFRTQSNFYTAFKELTGDSPGQYRKKYLN